MLLCASLKQVLGNISDYFYNKYVDYASKNMIFLAFDTYFQVALQKSLPVYTLSSTRCCGELSCLEFRIVGRDFGGHSLLPHGHTGSPQTPTPCVWFFYTQYLQYLSIPFLLSSSSSLSQFSLPSWHSITNLYCFLIYLFQASLYLVSLEGCFSKCLEKFLLSRTRSAM